GDYTVYHSTDAGVSFQGPKGGVDRYTSSNYIPFVNPAEVANGINAAPTLSADTFRTPPARVIVADPVRPGHVYAADVHFVADGEGNTVDAGEVIFSFSEDYGKTWQIAF